MRRLALLLVLGLAPLACGDGGEGPAPPSQAPEQAELTASERRAFDRAVVEIQRHCRRWARFVADREPISSAEAAEAFAAADELVELVRTKPSAPIGRSADVRLRVGDIAESVEGANCDPRLEQRLDEGIAAAVAAAPGG